MDVFKLFKEQPKSPSMVPAPASNATEKIWKSELIWQKFWGQYDAVLELACMRKSVNISHEHAVKIEEMFIESLEELILNTVALVDDYKKNQEAP